MNLTKRFENGYARVYYKFLNDRTAAYVPMPIKVTGTNSNPNWGNIEGFDATTGTQHSPYLTQNNGLDSNGNRRNADVADGMHPISNAIGAEFSFNLENISSFLRRAFKVFGLAVISRKSTYCF